MRLFRSVLALCVVLLGVTHALGQTRAGDRSSRSRVNSRRVLPSERYSSRRPRYNPANSRFYSRYDRGRVDAFGSRRSGGLVTRAEKIRSYDGLPFERREFGLIRPVEPLYSPIARDLRQRNLLRSRSTLGRRSASVIGRQDYDWVEDATPLPGSQSNPESGLKTSSYSDMLAARLQKKANDHFELGIAYFKAEQFLKARQHFQLARQINADHPKSYLAEMIVSYHRKDFNTAVINLEFALNRASSLNDLKIDWQEFYSSKQDFQRVVDSVSLLANLPKAPPNLSLMLAYYTWLNGDLNTAISLAQSAEMRIQAAKETKTKPSISGTTSIDEEPKRDKKRFSRLLIEFRDQPEVSMTGDQG